MQCCSFKCLGRGRLIAQPRSGGVGPKGNETKLGDGNLQLLMTIIRNGYIANYNETTALVEKIVIEGTWNKERSVQLSYT